MSEEMNADISTFLTGEYIYLRTPDIEKDVLHGRWFSWFNDKKVTRYLGQGIFPNTIEKQLEFVESLKKDSTKVVLSIIDKSNHNHIGVISFNNIDFINRRAAISLVIGEKHYPKAAPLEAMALMTEYGFDRLNLNKIDAGQSEALWNWVNALELLGYRIEGFLESLMIRDGKTHNGVHTGITAERFYRLREMRNGNIGTDDILNLFRQRSKVKTIDKVKSFFDNLYSE